jgi:hypothetical protein
VKADYSALSIGVIGAWNVPLYTNFIRYVWELPVKGLHTLLYVLSRTPVAT